MEMTARAFWTLVHGMGFGGLYLMACSWALVELWRRYAPGDLKHGADGNKSDDRFLARYLVMMAVVAWLAVLTGAYVVYPWYRAVPPAGTTDLAAFPQRLLLANAATKGWHTLGMEWKEHVAWVTPMAITMAAAVFGMYGGEIRRFPALRNAVLGFVAVSMLAAGIAGFFGAEIERHAPVEGGGTMVSVPGGK